MLASDETSRNVTDKDIDLMSSSQEEVMLRSQFGEAELMNSLEELMLRSQLGEADF